MELFIALRPFWQSLLRTFVSIKEEMACYMTFLAEIDGALKQNGKMFSDNKSVFARTDFIIPCVAGVSRLRWKDFVRISPWSKMRP